MPYLVRAIFRFNWVKISFSKIRLQKIKNSVIDAHPQEVNNLLINTKENIKAINLEVWNVASHIYNLWRYMTQSNMFPGEPWKTQKVFSYESAFKWGSKFPNRQHTNFYSRFWTYHIKIYIYIYWQNIRQHMKQYDSIIKCFWCKSLI